MAENVGTIYYEVDARTEPLVNSSTKAYRALDQLETNLANTDKVAANTANTLNGAVRKGLDNAGSGFSSISSKAKDAGRAVGGFADSVNAVKGSAAKGVISTAESIQDAAKASEDATDPLKKLTETMADGTTSANGFGFSMSALAKAISAVVLSGAVLGIAEMVQKYQEMSERVQMATASTQEFNDVQERLLKTANGTYRSQQEAQELYITTANSLRSMGYNTQQALDVTDSMSYAFVKNATSADKAKGAIDGFAKSINTGKVAADQWETLTSAIPSVIGDIAKASGKTAAEIRKLGAEGKLTSTQLTEGLRKSLEANTKAAADMSNNLIDATVRSKTAITGFFVAVEQQTGVLQKLTNGIIMAADNLLAFSTDSEGVATVISAVSSSAAILAAVISGRLVGAITGYLTTKGLLLTATLAQISADQSAAGAALMLARSNEASAAATLTAARAAEAAAVGFSHHAAMANALTIAQGEATLATQQLNAAMAANAGVATRAGLALKGLQSVMTFLGGPVGVVLIAAAALYYFSKSASETKVNVDELNKSIETLTFNQLGRSANEVGDDITKLNKKLSAAYSDFNTLTKSPFDTNDEFVQKQVAARAAIDDVNKELKARQDTLAKIAAAQDKLKNKETPKNDPNVTPTLPEDADSAKVIKNLQDQEALLKVIGVERAKLAAIQKLGDEASPAQRIEAEKLAASIYNLEQAEAKQKTAKKKGESEAASAAKKAATEEKKGIEDNQKEFAKLGESLASVDKAARDLAMDQAQLTLNKYATPEQIQSIRDIAGALYDAKGAKQALAAADPIANQNQMFTEQMKQLDMLHAAKGAYALDDARYDELSHAAKVANTAQLKILQEENFKSQTVGNQLLMEGIDALGQSATTAISGFLSGTGSLQEALGGIANTVLNTVIGAFEEMGVNWVKQQVMMAAAAQTTTAVQTAGIGTVAAVQAGATASIAATTTATAATTGTAVAGSMAPAAGLSSIASFGGAAVIGGAALLATMLLAKSFGGGRRAGGAVAPNSVYRVNEGGAPEVFNAGGQQYMIPNQRGQVVSNKNATADQGTTGAGTEVNIHNYTSANASVTRSQGQNGKEVIDVVLQDLATGGPVSRSINQITGTRRAGT